MSVEWNSPEMMAQIRPAVMRGVTAWIGAVEQKAVDLITSPPKTGRIYKRRGVEHQASAPGEAPASDTGRLVNSRTIDLFPEDLRARLTFRTDYAAALEFGTEKMAPRPFAERSLKETEGQAQGFFNAEISAVLGPKP